MFNLKMKKILIIAGAAASAITLSTFSGFTTGLPTESLIAQTIGVSNETGSSSGQEVDNSDNTFEDFASDNTFEDFASDNTSEDFVNEEIAKNQLPKIIKLKTPGDYILVGARAASTSKNRNPNAIIVNSSDIIQITNYGQFNITLDNVFIDIYDKVEGWYSTPMELGVCANVNLILIGKNYLKSHSQYSYGLDARTSSLTITESGKGASLDVSGNEYGIVGTDITIGGGKIKVTGSTGIYGGIPLISSNCPGVPISSMTINGGNIELLGDEEGIECDNIVINGGNITTSGNQYGIYSPYHDIIINGGRVVTNSKQRGMQGRQITINGGTITAMGDDYCGISAGDATINGGNTDANRIWIDKLLRVNQGNINLANAIKDNEKNHKECTILADNIEVNGGNINATRLGSKYMEVHKGIVTSNWMKIDHDLSLYGGIINIKKLILNDQAIINNGKITSNFVQIGNDLEINDGIVDVDKIESKNITINGGNINFCEVDLKDGLNIEGGTITSGLVKASNYLEINGGIIDLDKIESKNIAIESANVSKIKSINGIKYDFENSKYTLPFYAVDAREKHKENEKNILENLWKSFRKSNSGESNISANNNCFSDCRFMFQD